jgi:predicted metal-binding membrane protein
VTGGRLESSGVGRDRGTAEDDGSSGDVPDGNLRTEASDPALKGPAAASRHGALRARFSDLESATGGAIRLLRSYNAGDHQGTRWVVQLSETSGRTFSTREAEAFVLGCHSGLDTDAATVGNRVTTVSEQASAAPDAERRRNLVVLVALVVLAAAGWVVFLAQARHGMTTGDGMTMGGGMGMGHNAGPDLTMGRSWPLFFAMWVAMMAAMMFPTAAPMVMTYARTRRTDHTSVALFTGAYIGLWILFGAVAYLLGAGVEVAVSHSEWVAMNWGRAGGALLVVAGLYQLSPVKRACLRPCRLPSEFVTNRWRDGRRGAVWMGLEHGALCLGTCWLIFLVLIPLGIMNAAAMVAVAALVFAERVLRTGRTIGIIAGAALVIYGIAVAIHPALLPTVA